MANANPQQSLALIPHVYEGELIALRATDGYINATSMCRAAGKDWSTYRRRGSTEDFFKALALDLKIPQDQLAFSIQGTPGGDARNQGTWVHPQIAVHLAQYLSAEFAVQVTRWIVDWMTGLDPRDRVWQQYQDRVSLVYDNVPEGYFAVFNEISSMVAALITSGAEFGTKMILDISVGCRWATYWKANGLSETFGPRASFDHHFPRYFPQAWSNPQKAKCYPEEALHVFRRWLREVYMPTHLPTYLGDQVRQGRLPAAIATSTRDALEHQQRNRALPKPD